MKEFVILSLLLVVDALSPRNPSVSKYAGYKVVRVSVGAELDRLNGIVSDLDLATWKGAPKAGAFSDIVVPPSQVDAFHGLIQGMDATTMHADLGAAIAKEAEFETYSAGSANATWFDSYHSYRDHMQFLEDLVARYPNESEIVTSGSSLDGRPIKGIHLFGSSGKGVRPAVVFHGTVHAREWISTMVVEYMAFHLLTNYDSSDEVRRFIDTYDFYMFPVVNPDGFVYTQTTDRLWRKNRQVTDNNMTCIGRDINRNWPIQWALMGGSSADPCAEDYRGVAQGDAPETVALLSHLQEIKDAQGLKLYIDYHSYSQMFMAPYGYSCIARPAKNEELLALAEGAANAIYEVHGVWFQSGSICSMLYKTTGNSVDYVNDVVKADYSFTSELRDMGQSGFVLPASEILPSGEEAFAAVRYLLRNMK